MTFSHGKISWLKANFCTNTCLATNLIRWYWCHGKFLSTAFSFLLLNFPWIFISVAITFLRNLPWNQLTNNFKSDFHLLERSVIVPNFVYYLKRLVRSFRYCIRMVLQIFFFFLLILILILTNVNLMELI